MLSDLRYAFRSLRQHPGYSLLAIAVLALGIGPTSALLSLANQLVFRPIPHVRDPGRLAIVYFGQGNPRTGWSPRSVSEASRTALVAASPAVGELAGFWPSPPLSAAADRVTPRRVPGQFVTGNFFRLLGVRPVLGRTFSRDDDLSGAAPVAVIGYSLWSGMLAHDPQVLGRTLRVNGEAFTIIGVLPAGFRGIQALSDIELWLPAATQPAVRHMPAAFRQRAATQGMPYFVMRLTPGGTFQRAEAQLRVAIPRVAAMQGDEQLAEAAPLVYPKLGVFAFVRASTDRILRLLFGVGAMLLLIACANVANLALFRAVRRRGETAVRAALGAGTLRVARLHLAESLMIALAGAGAGVVLAVWLTALFRGSQFPDVGAMPPFTLDWRVVGVTAAVAVTVGVLLGLLPTAVRERVQLSTTLKDATRTGTAGRHLLRAGLTAVQFGLCLTLLVATFLFVGALRNLYRVDLGFDPSHVTTFQFHLGDQGYTDQQTLTYYEAMLQRMRSLPAVAAATISGAVPLMGFRATAEVRLPSAGPPTALNVATNGVTSSYFDVLKMALMRGRPLTAADLSRDGSTGPVPAVISQSLARQLFGDRSPLGETLSSTAVRSSGGLVVVGVVQDVRWLGPTAESEPMMYVPLTQAHFLRERAVLLVRSALPSGSLAAAIRRVAAELDPTAPVGEVETLDGMLARLTSEQSLFSKVLSALSALAILLAAAGLYGLVSQTVAERARELGIRIAVGADGRDVLALVLRRASVLTAIGAAAGLAGAFAAAHTIRAYLFGVRPLDPMFYLAAIIVLAAAALVAAYVPARRATRIDPVQALRAE